jgi:D-alanyl-D-alanine carboxypeptidase/D-alanyl-D-alanine-endopeptidase (penicillin-binding protein 4)
MRCLILLLAAFLFNTCVFAQATTSKQIDQLIKQLPGDVDLGILVIEANSGKVVYTKNADRYFQPASNQKLLTAYAAMHYLPMQYTYQTRLFANLAQVKNHILQDNLYIQFTGDPTLTFNQFQNLLATLSAYGIQQINGNIIIDDSHFDDVMMSPGTAWDDKHFCYGAPVSAISLDHNCVSLLLRPQALNQLVDISPTTVPFFMSIVDAVKTSPAEESCRLHVKAEPSQYHISGCVHANDNDKTLNLAITDPRKHIQNVIAYILKLQHINFNQGIVFQKFTNVPPLIAAAVSPPLSQLINTMLKQSDNLIANALFKTVGGVYAKSPGDWQNGSEAVRMSLAKVNIEIPNTTVIDGAGASRYNGLTPRQMVALLRQIYLSKQASFFINSLPVAGMDGTLKDRMRGSETRGFVWAKTGTETGVSSLAGVLKTKQNKLLIFAIVSNGFVDLPIAYKNLEDNICTSLIENL